MLESTFRHPIQECLAWHKFEIVRVHAGQRQLANGGWIIGPPVGTFDYTIGYLKDGVYLLAYLEAKQGRDKLNVDQIRFARRVNALGIPWLVATGVADVELWIKDIAYHGPLEAIEEVFSNKVFVPTAIRRGRQKLTMATMHEYNRWADKKVSTEGLATEGKT